VRNSVFSCFAAWQVGIVVNGLGGDLEAGAIAPVMPGMQISQQKLGCMMSSCIEPGSFSWGLLDAPLVRGPDLVRLIDYHRGFNKQMLCCQCAVVQCHAA
jgi:hypothetical protein